MLSHININKLPDRPESATFHCHQQRKPKTNNQDANSVFLNNCHIILPKNKHEKTYLASRRRELSEQTAFWKGKTKQNSKYYIQIKTHSNKKVKNPNVKECNKQNSYTKDLKSQMWDKSAQNRESITTINELEEEKKNKNLNLTPLQINSKKQMSHIFQSQCALQQFKQYANAFKKTQKKLALAQKKVQKISTSRALELFSKIIKKENIQRLKMRKQIVTNTSDVHIRQVVFQNKKTERPKITVGLARRPQINQACSVLSWNRKKEKQSLENEMEVAEEKKQERNEMKMVEEKKQERKQERREKRRYRKKYIKSMITDQQENYQLVGW